MKKLILAAALLAFNATASDLPEVIEADSVINPNHGQTVITNSTGGDIDAALAMAAYVRANNLDTKITGVCNSACGIVFLAGKTKTLGRGGSLGIHAPAYIEEGELPKKVEKYGKT